MGNLFVFLVGGRLPRVPRSLFLVPLLRVFRIECEEGYSRGEGDVSMDEGKPNVVIEMAVSAFVPNCRQEISDGLMILYFTAHYLIGYRR